MARVAATGSFLAARGAALKTINVNPTAIGDALVLYVVQPAVSPAVITGVSGGGVTKWFLAGQVNNGAGAGSVDIWYGAVTATGSSTITITSPNGTGQNELMAQQFTMGAPAIWTQDSASVFNIYGSSGTVTSGNYASQSPNTEGELYLGMISCSGGTLGGASAGFTYKVGTLAEAVYALGASNPTAYAPAFTCTSGFATSLAATIVGSVIQANAPNQFNAPSGAPRHEWQPNVAGAAPNSIVIQTTSAAVASQALMVLTFPAPTSGGAVILCLTSDDNFFQYQTPAVWDDGDNVWTRVNWTAGGAQGLCEIWATTAPTTPLQNIYVNRNGTAGTNRKLLSVGWALDVSNITGIGFNQTGNSNTTTANSGTHRTDAISGQMPELLVGILGAQSGTASTTFTAQTPGFVNLPSLIATTGSAWVSGQLGYTYVGFQQVQSYSATIGASQNWSDLLAVFTPGLGSGIPGQQQGPLFWSPAPRRPVIFGPNPSQISPRQRQAASSYSPTFSGTLSLTSPANLKNSITSTSNTTGALSFVGPISLTNRIGKALAAVLSFLGPTNLKNAIGKKVTGTLSFVGPTNLKNAITKSMTATLSFSGSLSRAMTTHLVAAVLSFAGAATKLTKKSSGLTATLSFVGAQSRAMGAHLAGTLSFAGNSVTRAVSKGVTTTLSFSGALSRAITKTHTAAVLSFVGSQSRSIRKGVAATLSFSGAQIRSMGAHLTGTVSFAGSVARTIPKTLASATLSFSGAATKTTVHALTATLSFAGSLARAIKSRQTATLSFAGAQTRAITRTAMSAALSFAGVFSHALLKTFTATLSFVGSIPARGIHSTQSGTLSFSGAQSRAIRRGLTATLSFVGTQSRAVARGVTGTLSFAGTVTKTTAKMLVGATLSFTGAVGRRVSKTVTSTLTFAGAQSRAVAKRIAGTLSFTGAWFWSIARILTANLSFAGVVSLTRTVHVALAGALSFSGNLPRHTKKALSATLSFLGTWRFFRGSAQLSVSDSAVYTCAATDVSIGGVALSDALVGGVTLADVLAGAVASSDAAVNVVVMTDVLALN